jgi:hypothetical protein
MKTSQRSAPHSRMSGYPMSPNVSEFVWKRLSEWGLSRAYGYPRDGAGSLETARGTLTTGHRARDQFPMGGEQP